MLNTVLYPMMANPGALKAPATVFVSGDDDEAESSGGWLAARVRLFRGLIKDLGGIESAQGIRH